MGQYYHPVNLDKKQYLHPHRLGDGLKLLEFGLSGDGTMAAMAILLCDGNGRGGGDLHIEDDSPAAAIVGSWAGDRIVIAGDYADPGKWLDGATEAELQKVADEYYSEGYNKPENVNLYSWACTNFEDITPKIVQAMLADDYLRNIFRDKQQFYAQVPDDATDKTPLVYDEEARCYRLKAPATC